MVKTITESQRLQLLGLVVLGIEHYKIVNSVEDLATKIVEDKVGGHLSDMIYEADLDIDKRLGYMGITVVADK